MRRFRDLLQHDDESGFTMAEVIVALMVFTVIAVGMAASLLSMTRLVSDDRNREVAANLAAQEIDRLRSVTNPFSVYSNATQTQTVGNTTYTIDREVSWVSTTGSTANCGGGGGVLQYKRVNVSVSWPGQFTLTNPVQADTILAPSTRINDPSLGTILVSVLGADGSGRSGVGVTVTPTSGGAAVGAVAATDVDGCSYVLKVTPGTYSVQISKTGYIDLNQVVSPSVSLSVTAGSSQTANFQYDQQATFNLKYANSFANEVLPTSLTTNFVTTVGNFSTTSTSTPRLLFPYSTGYAAIAGVMTNCLAVDAQNWAAGKVSGIPMAAGQRSKLGLPPGGGGTLNVPMGIVAVTVPAQATSFSAAGLVTGPSGTGDPGCATPTTYKFSFATAPAAGSVVYLALPFGSWTINSVNALLVSTPMTTGFTPSTQGELTGSVVTLDPRVPS